VEGYKTILRLPYEVEDPKMARATEVAKSFTFKVCAKAQEDTCTGAITAISGYSDLGLVPKAAKPAFNFLQKKAASFCGSSTFSQLDRLSDAGVYVGSRVTRMPVELINEGIIFGKANVILNVQKLPFAISQAVNPHVLIPVQEVAFLESTSFETQIVAPGGNMIPPFVDHFATSQPHLPIPFTGHGPNEVNIIEQPPVVPDVHQGVHPDVTNRFRKRKTNMLT
jgi:hypothetical protein